MIPATNGAPLLNHWSVVFTLISDTLLLGSLIFLALQVRQQKLETSRQIAETTKENEYRRQELHVQTFGNLQPFFLEMFRDTQLAKIWGVGRVSHLALNEDEQQQFKWACVFWFEHIGAIYRMSALKLIDDTDLNGWERTLRDDFVHDKKPGLVHWWYELKEDYEEQFRKWVETTIGSELECDCDECEAKRAVE